MRGQLMLITAVIISLMMMTTGSAMADLGDRTYDYREEGYMVEILKDEAAKVQTRFRKDRENFRKMINFLDGYTTSVEYSRTQRCFNVSLSGTKSNLELRCIS